MYPTDVLGAIVQRGARTHRHDHTIGSVASVMTAERFSLLMHVCLFCDDVSLTIHSARVVCPGDEGGETEIEARTAARAAGSAAGREALQECVHQKWEAYRLSRASGDRGCCGETEGEARAVARAVASIVWGRSIAGVSSPAERSVRRCCSPAGTEGVVARLGVRHVLLHVLWLRWLGEKSCGSVFIN